MHLHMISGQGAERAKNVMCLGKSKEGGERGGGGGFPVGHIRLRCDASSYEDMC